MTREDAFEIEEAVPAVPSEECFVNCLLDGGKLCLSYDVVCCLGNF